MKLRQPLQGNAADLFEFAKTVPVIKSIVYGWGDRLEHLLRHGGGQGLCMCWQRVCLAHAGELPR